MNRRALLERLAAAAAVAGAGCVSMSGTDGTDTTAGSRTATAAEQGTATVGGPRSETASEETTGQPTTTGGPPNIPRPGTPPVATTPGRTTGGGPPDIPPPGTPPGPHETTGISCSLSHRVVDSGDNLTPSSVSVIQYADLSTAAKRIVGRAIESNETVSIPYDSRQKPPEFAYSDESHVYDIEYRGTTYRLVTATGMGCPVITATE